MNHLNSTDLYERLTSYYADLSSKESQLFSAAVILMLSNYVESQDHLFDIFNEVRNVLFIKRGE